DAQVPRDLADLDGLALAARVGEREAQAADDEVRAALHEGLVIGEAQARGGAGAGAGGDADLNRIGRGNGRRSLVAASLEAGEAAVDEVVEVVDGEIERDGHGAAQALDQHAVARQLDRRVLEARRGREVDQREVAGLDGEVEIDLAAG